MNHVVLPRGSVLRHSICVSVVCLQTGSADDCGPGGFGRLTVHSQEVVEQLEEREAVPAVGRLHFQSCVHVG